jgi:Fe-S oxidoreductase
MAYGDTKKARRDLKYNVKRLAEAVRQGCKIVCSEPSAVLCLSEELRLFVRGENAKLVSENTYELMNYLLDLHSQKKLKSPARRITDEYIYHTPCHLQVVNDGTATIRLLKDLCGIKVTDLKAGCCGLSGTFGMQKKNYELSSKIAESLKSALTESQTQNVLTECAACKMQIEHISDKVPVHPLKILAEAYGL